MPDINILQDHQVFMMTIIQSKDEEYNRLIDDLDFYLLECKDKQYQMYYFIKNDLFYILINKRVNTLWKSSNINLLVSNALKTGSFLCLETQGFFGKMDPTFWDHLNRADEFFKNISNVRKDLKEELKLVIRKRKLEKLIDKIDEKTK